VLRNDQLVKLLQRHGCDMDTVLVTINSGPYRSPSKIVPLIGTDDTIIEATYPREQKTVREVFMALQELPPHGNVQVYVGGHQNWSGYYGVTRINHYRDNVVIVADTYLTGPA
jgi:hypothetical protein